METKQKILFLHSAGQQGSAGKGSNDFVLSLRKALGSQLEIIYPIVEQPENPSYDKWKSLLNRELNKLTGKIILIGHSLGGSMLLKYLSEEPTNKSIEGIFLVSIPQWSSDGWDATEFALREDFTLSLPPIANISFYHCTNDPFVPFDHLDYYKKYFKNSMFRELQCADHAFSNGLPALVTDIINLLI